MFPVSSTPIPSCSSHSSAQVLIRGARYRKEFEHRFSAHSCAFKLHSSLLLPPLYPSPNLEIQKLKCSQSYNISAVQEAVLENDSVQVHVPGALAESRGNVFEPADSTFWDPIDSPLQGVPTASDVPTLMEPSESPLQDVTTITNGSSSFEPADSSLQDLTSATYPPTSLELTGSPLQDVFITVDDPSSLESTSNPLRDVTTRIDDLVTEISTFVGRSLNAVSSLISSMVDGAQERVDAASNGLISAVDKSQSMTLDRLRSMTTSLNETSSKAASTSISVLRSAIVVAEDSVANGVSFFADKYGSVKELLPQQIQDGLKLSEEKCIVILTPVGVAIQQGYAAIQAVEKTIGLNPDDPIVPFTLFLGTATTLWALYRVWTYGGYSGNLSPESCFKLLLEKESAALVDVRSEILREIDGIPDLRRGARFRYANVAALQLEDSVKQLIRGGKTVDDSLIAVVIRNLKIVEGMSKVIIMDADGSRSKGIARSLRKLGVKQAYVVDGGFKSWKSKGLRVKELKPESALTILNEETEAIIEDINPSPVQILGYGVGSLAALYALVEWEKSLQVIGVLGITVTTVARVVSYENPGDFTRDLRLLFTPVTLGTRAFSWAAGKLEGNGFGLRTAPSSSDVKNRVLMAAAKHESQPSESERNQSQAAGSESTIDDRADLSGA